MLKNQISDYLGMRDGWESLREEGTQSGLRKFSGLTKIFIILIVVLSTCMYNTHFIVEI